MLIMLFIKHYKASNYSCFRSSNFGATFSIILLGGIGFGRGGAFGFTPCEGFGRGDFFVFGRLSFIFGGSYGIVEPFDIDNSI